MRRCIAIFLIVVTRSAFAVPLPNFGIGENPYIALYHQTDKLVIISTYDKISALEREYNAAVAREQSLANRILGAAAISAGGIGGMMLASGIAEQRANENAERDMSAYLATFRCDYGAGMNITGGQTNIQLPGASVLLPLYNEYIALAADLKVRKEALGMSPGIESTIIADAVSSGMYDNAATGITNGAYTSLSRALSDPTGADADDGRPKNQIPHPRFKRVAL